MFRQQWDAGSSEPREYASVTDLGIPVILTHLLRLWVIRPHLNWSTLRYVFGHEEEDRNAEKAPQA